MHEFIESNDLKYISNDHALCPNFHCELYYALMSISHKLHEIDELHFNNFLRNYE